MAKRISSVLIDLSGTLYIENNVLPGAIEALKRLREKRLKVKFVTNTTKESKETLLNHLTKIGFDIKEEEVFTCLTAAKSLILRQNLRPLYFLSDDARKDFVGISTKNENSVVVGLAPDKFTYENMTKALRLLLDGAPLIAIHKSRYYKRDDGLALGPGAFVSALEYSADCKAVVVGKPEASFFHSALQEMDCVPHESVMIGDDIRGDIEGALKAGLEGILVKTGKYRTGDEEKFNISPTHVAETFADAVSYLLTRIF